MAALTPVVAARAGGGSLTTGLVASSASDTFPAGPNTYLLVQVTGGAAVTVTVTPPSAGGPLGLTNAPLALAPVVEATTGLRMYGPFPQYPFGDQNGNVTVTCSVTGATTKVCPVIVSG